jgi:membrane protein
MRLVLFYAGLTLVPILIAVGFAVTGRIQDAVDTSILSLLLPVLLTSIAFVAAIRLLPDTDVRWGPAMLGGLASAILFEGAKVGFNTYVSVLGADDAASAIYGSLALFPIFLLWLYVLWVIVLFGVELAFVTQRHGELFAAEERRLLGLPYARRHADALFALQCLLVVARRFVGGEGPVSESFVTRALGTEPTFVRNALESLEDAGILAQAPLGYLPALPLERLTLRDVILRYRALTRPALVDDAPGTEVVAAVIGGPGAVLDATVAQMLEKPPGAGAAAVEAAG